MDEPYTLPEAAEAAQLWLRSHRARSRVTMHRSIEDVLHILTEAARHAAVIRSAAPALGLHPGVVAWAELAADEIADVARRHIDGTLKPIAERRGAAARARQVALVEAAETDKARARRITARSLAALVGTDIVITVDGVSHAGRVTHATRGPVLHVRRDDGREILITAR